MYKIRITGLNIPKAEDGVETTCPQGQYWNETFKRCMPIPEGGFPSVKQTFVGPSNKSFSAAASNGETVYSNRHPNLYKLKNKVGAYLNSTPTLGEATFNLFDPSGLSNLKYVNQSLDEALRNPGVLNTILAGADVAGTVPIGGIFARSGKKLGQKLSSMKWKNATKEMSRAGKAGYAASWPARMYRRYMEWPAIITDDVLRLPHFGNRINKWNRGARFTDAAGRYIDDYESPAGPKYAFGGPHSEIPSLFSTEPDRLHKAEVGGVREDCDEGYKWDDLSKQCIVDPNYIPRINFKNKLDGNDVAPPEMSEEEKRQDAAEKNYQNWLQKPQNELSTKEWAQDFQNKFNLHPTYDPSKKYNEKGNEIVPKAKRTGAGLVKAANNFDIWSSMLTGVAQTYSDIKKANEAQKEFDRTFRESRDPFYRYANVQDPEGSRGFFQTNTGKNPEAGFKTVGEDGGTMLTDTDMNKIKIKITGGPNAKMAYGGQSGYGFDLGQRNTYAAMPEGKIQTVSSTIKEVPREQANIEAEKGETVYADVDGDGVHEHMKIEGKRHVDGGTPLNVPEGSFVFSDTKKMVIKDETILDKFGLSPRKQGYTPAEIAKKYDINKYKAIIEDPNSDALMKNTAQLMVKNYQKKLAELALIQEEMKGFPQGIPQMCYGVLPDEMLQAIQAQIDEAKGQSGAMSPEQEQQAAQSMQPGEEDNGIQEPNEGTPEEESPEMMYGGDLEYGGDLNYFTDDDIYEFANGGEGPDDPVGVNNSFDLNQWNQLQNAGKAIQDNQAGVGDPYDPTEDNQIVPWPGDENENLENKSKYTKEQWAQKLRRAGYKGPLNNKAVQEWLYKQPASRTIIDKNHSIYGAPKDGMFDGKIGYRWDEALDVLTPPVDDETVYGYKCTGRDGNNNPMIVSSSYINAAARTADGAAASEQEAYKQCEQKSSTVPNEVVTPKLPPTKVPFKYMTPDIWKMAGALGMRGNKYLPYIADVSFEPNRFQKEDWYSKASQLESAARQAGEQIGAFKSGQASAADISNLTANQAENLIGAIADVDARNVRGVNAFNQAEQDRKDKFNLLRAANATERGKGNAIANQAWDNFINRKTDKIIDTGANAWENRMKLGLINTTNKFYYTDPITGRTIFKGGYGPEDIGATDNSTGWASVSSEYAKAKAQPGFENLTIDQFIKMTGKGSKADTGKYGGTTGKNKKTTLSDLANVLSKGYGFPF